jgi:hypothetical protein
MLKTTDSRGVSRERNSASLWLCDWVANPIVPRVDRLHQSSHSNYAMTFIRALPAVSPLELGRAFAEIDEVVLKRKRFRLGISLNTTYIHCRLAGPHPREEVRVEAAPASPRALWSASLVSISPYDPIAEVARLGPRTNR